MSDISRVLIAGLGSIGARHARRAGHLLPDAQCAVLRSGNGATAPEDLVHLKVFVDVADALSWYPDAAIIATPAPYHVRLARDLLEAKVPVLIEKPVSTSVEGLPELIELAGQSGIPVGVAYVLRHRLLVQEVQRVLSSGALGVMQSATFTSSSWLPDWRPGVDYRQSVSARADLGGGALLELSHEIDLACLLCGVPCSVSARLSRGGDLEIDVEDTAELTWQVASGMTVSVHVDFCSKSVTRGFEIIGSQGQLRANLVTGALRILDTGDDARESSFPEPDRDAMYDRQLSDFFDAVRTGNSPACSLAQAAQVMAVIDAARRSDAAGSAQGVEL